MGLPYLEEILFDSSGLVSGLEAKGAVVKRAECGYNHWLLAPRSSWATDIGIYIHTVHQKNNIYICNIYIYFAILYV